MKNCTSVNSFFRLSNSGSQLLKLRLLGFVLVFFLFQKNTYAINYVFKGFADWTSVANWSPSYPGDFVTYSSYDPSPNTITISAGSIVKINSQIESSAPFTNNGYIAVLSGKKLLLHSSVPHVNNGTIEVVGAFENRPLYNMKFTNSATGSIVVSGSLYLNKNLLVNYGSINVKSTGTFDTYLGDINNYGTAKWSISGKMSIDRAISFVQNQAENIFTIEKSGSLTLISSTLVENKGSFTNGGTFISHCAVSNAATGKFLNNGILDFKTTAAFTNNGMVENNATGSLFAGGIKNVKGAKWSGKGSTKGGSFNNLGTLSPGAQLPGIITVEHSYKPFVCNDGGIYEVQIAGTGGPGLSTGNDQLIVRGGSMYFAETGTGIINISLINNYIPNPGTSFKIILCDGLNDKQTINYPVLPNNRNWSHSYTKNGTAITELIVTAN